MSATFIVSYIMTIISVLLGVAGFIILIYGLVNKKKGMTIYGSIMSFIAILIIVTGIFICLKRVKHVIHMRCEKANNFRMHMEFMQSKCCHMHDPMCNHEDSCCKKMKEEPGCCKKK